MRVASRLLSENLRQESKAAKVGSLAPFGSLAWRLWQPILSGTNVLKKCGHRPDNACLVVRRQPFVQGQRQRPSEDPVGHREVALAEAVAAPVVRDHRHVPGADLGL